MLLAWWSSLHCDSWLLPVTTCEPHCAQLDGQATFSGEHRARVSPPDWHHPEVTREPATSLTSAAMGVNKIQCGLATQEASGPAVGSVAKLRERLGIFSLLK